MHCCPYGSGTKDLETSNAWCEFIGILLYKSQLESGRLKNLKSVRHTLCLVYDATDYASSKQQAVICYSEKQSKE